MKVTLYRFGPGRYALLPVDGAEKLTGELAEGYSLGKGLGGSAATTIFGRAGTLGMSVEQAVRAGVLVLDPSPKR